MNSNTPYEIETFFRNKTTLTYEKFYADNNYPVFPPHWHNGIEILYVIKGKLQVNISSNTLRLNAGDICFINTKQTHFGISCSDGLEYDMIQINMETLEKIRGLHKNINSFLSHDINIQRSFKNKKISELFGRAAEFYDPQSTDNNLILIGIICELFGHMLKDHIDTEKIALYVNERFSEVLRYLDEHHTENISITELADQFSFEVSYFSRKFKEIIGITPSQYICILRLLTAEKMLADTNFSVEIVSQKCGFESANYFARCFKERYNISPLKYRKANRNKTEKDEQ